MPLTDIQKKFLRKAIRYYNYDDVRQAQIGTSDDMALSDIKRYLAVYLPQTSDLIAMLTEEYDQAKELNNQFGP